MKGLGLRSAAVFGVGFLVAGCAQFGAGDDVGGGDGGAPQVRAVPTVLVVDSSGSMAEDDAPGPRIDAAKQAATALMSELPEGTPTALVTYGANTDDLPESQVVSCEDITVLRPLSPLEAAEGGAVDPSAEAAVEGLAPGGFTPIGRALGVAAAELEGLDAEGEKSIVLVSDGEDTCSDPTPCEAAREITQAQPDVVISTIGFKSDVEELACVARETGGLYLTADNVDQLVSRVVAAQNGEAVLTPTGRSGIELGQHFDDIRSANPDFPDQETGEAEGELIVIRWVDCDWVFDKDGNLVEIRDDGAATIDGLTVGTSIDRARELYGEPVETVSEGGDEVVELYVASQEAGTAWKITSDGSDKVVTVVLCSCIPGTGGKKFRAGSTGSDLSQAQLPAWAQDAGATSVEILRPVDFAGRVQPGFTVESSSSGRCLADGEFVDRSASTAVESGTVQCDNTTAAAASECWPDETSYGALCMFDDLTTLRSFSSPRMLTGHPVSTESEPRPLFAKTRDGSLCRYVFGGSNSLLEVDGKAYVPRVYCDGKLRLLDTDDGVFSRSGDGIVAMGTRDTETIFPVEIETVYFLGTA